MSNRPEDTDRGAVVTDTGREGWIHLGKRMVIELRIASKYENIDNYI